MKIFITGATGYIGRNLLRMLIKIGHQCTAYVRQTSDISFIDTNNCKLFYETDINSLLTHFNEHQYDGVVHLAALFIESPKHGDIPSLINSNILLGTNILEVAVSSNVKWFINTGTFMQHYNNESYNPSNFYAATKQAFEDIAKYYYETSDICFTTLKINNTYGPNDPRPKIFNLWKKIAVTGEFIDMSPGCQFIDITHIDDIVAGYLILLQEMSSNKTNYKGAAFRLSSRRKCTLLELSLAFEKSLNCKLNINWGSKPYRSREFMDPPGYPKILPNWSPAIAIEKGLTTL